ncbi:hypothetical protein AZ017_002573, partial [Klebsiella pneumoniae]
GYIISDWLLLLVLYLLSLLYLSN